MDKTKIASEEFFKLMFFLQGFFKQTFHENLICGMTKSHFKVLIDLSCNGKKNLHTLAGELNIASPNLSRILRDLESKDLIKREIPDDNRRTTYFSITGVGLKQIDSIKKKAKLKIEELLGNLNGHDLEQVCQAIKQINAILIQGSYK